MARLWACEAGHLLGKELGPDKGAEGERRARAQGAEDVVAKAKRLGVKPGGHRHDCDGGDEEQCQGTALAAHIHRELGMNPHVLAGKKCRG